MSSKAQQSIEKRVNETISSALKHHQYVSAIDVLVGMKLLTPEKVEAWKKGQVPYLEKVVNGGLGTISRAMKFFRQQAVRGELRQSETAYLTKGSGKRPLRFSKSGNPNIEKAYRTHFLAKTLKKKNGQEKIVGENQTGDQKSDLSGVVKISAT